MIRITRAVESESQVTFYVEGRLVVPEVNELEREMHLLLAAGKKVVLDLGGGELNWCSGRSDLEAPAARRRGDQGARSHREPLERRTRPLTCLNERYKDSATLVLLQPEFNETGGEQTSLVGAIAHELAKIHRATPVEHWRAARRLLEDAFRVVEETAVDGTSAGGRPVGGARPYRAELAHAC